MWLIAAGADPLTKDNVRAFAKEGLEGHLTLDK